MPTLRPKALVFDRDGTLIEHVPYLHEPAKVKLLDGVRAALADARAAGLLFFLHTNQSGVGRGMFDLAAVDACNRRLIELLDLGPAPFARIAVAPEHPDQPSAYRKPSPQFARELMRDFHLAPAELCYVGDRGADLETARAAGTAGVGVTTGLEDLRGEVAALGLAADFPLFPSLRQAVSALLQLPP